ncbi:hypothetical protein Agub_g4670, partial [Astrephomene gubernaculifera]
FGNFGDDRPALAAAKHYPRSVGGGGGAAGAGGGRGAGGPGGTSGSHPKGADGADVDLQDAGGDVKPFEAKSHLTKPRAPVLDYTQYYPTLLPLRLPGSEVWEDEGGGEGEGGFRPSCQDLASQPDPPQQPAAELDLWDPEVEDQMFLMQLPSVMPLQPP